MRQRRQEVARWPRKCKGERVGAIVGRDGIANQRLNGAVRPPIPAVLRIEGGAILDRGEQIAIGRLRAGIGDAIYRPGVVGRLDRRTVGEPLLWAQVKGVHEAIRAHCPRIGAPRLDMAIAVSRHQCIEEQALHLKPGGHVRRGGIEFGKRQVPGHPQRLILRHIGWL